MVLGSRMLSMTSEPVRVQNRVETMIETFNMSRVIDIQRSCSRRLSRWLKLRTPPEPETGPQGDVLELQ